MSSSRGMDPSTLEEEGKTFLQKHQETLNHQHNGIFQKKKPETRILALIKICITSLSSPL